MNTPKQPNKTKPNYYDELKVNRVIHAAGTKTTHGGTRMHPDAIAAMQQASESFVSIEDLNRAIGKYIAHITTAEAGMVTSGAASGVVLSIAACITGTSHAAIKQLPDTTGLKNECIMQHHHYGPYSHMYTFPGNKIRLIGDANDCCEQDLESAINEKTAAIAFLFGPRISTIGLSLKQVCRIAKRYGIFVIVDAAAMLPPKENLKKYILEGADLVTISGGKMIHGPQNTGILFGKKDLIEAAMANNSPHHAIGRPYKVSREAMVGLYVALKQFMALDEAAYYKACRQQLEPLIDRLNKLPWVRVECVHDQINYNVPVATIQLTSEWTGIPASKVPAYMLKGKPSIFMQYFKSLNHLVVNPVSVQKNEMAMVSEKLFQLFASNKSDQPKHIEKENSLC
jgi:uncharacterized pyridoxal phosphate-dependent enzyme